MFTSRLMGECGRSPILITQVPVEYRDHFHIPHAPRDTRVGMNLPRWYIMHARYKVPSICVRAMAASYSSCMVTLAPQAKDKTSTCHSCGRLLAMQ